MSARVRRPTDEVATEIYDPERQRALLHAPPPDAGSPGPRAASFEQDATEVTPIPGGPVGESATPAHADPDPGAAAAPASALDPHPVEPAAPTERRQLERSEPIRVISMKEHTEAAGPRSDDARVPLHVQLRAMAEVAGRNGSPVGLGHLAPPRDPRQARARRVRGNVAWACVAVVLACAISLAIWLVAGR